MKQSPLYSLNLHDALKGFILAVVTPILTSIERYLDAGKIDFSWKSLAMIGIGAGLAYIIKNFFTPAATTKEVIKTEDGTITKTLVNSDSVKVEVTPSENQQK